MFIAAVKEDCPTVSQWTTAKLFDGFPWVDCIAKGGDRHRLEEGALGASPFPSTMWGKARTRILATGIEGYGYRHFLAFADDIDHHTLSGLTRFNFVEKIFDG